MLTTRRLFVLLAGVAVLLLGTALWAGLRQRDKGVALARLVALPTEQAGFARADGPKDLVFPADRGSHPDYQTEWWYYTGNLQTANALHYGYQLTFFRRALLPPQEQSPRESKWAASQVYMAHFAISNVPDRRFRAFERVSRGSVGLAGAAGEPYHVWLENWSVEEVESGVVHLHAEQDDLFLDLTLTDRKGVVLEGDRGYSQKGAEPGNASYYYSQTRLETVGTLQVGGRKDEVTGLSWMDHEFSTSSLAPGQVGWDWFALQMDDGSELMVYQIRRKDGSADPSSSGTLVAPDGTARHLTRDDFRIGLTNQWRSPHSGANYPARWTVEVPVASLTLRIEPYLADQELNLSYSYWEGAVHFTGEHAGLAVSGDGYVELTGYAGTMQGQF